MESPGSETRESMTCVSTLPQNGHFIAGSRGSAVDGKARGQRRHAFERRGNDLVVPRRVEDIRDQMPQLLAFELGESTRGDRGTAHAYARRDERLFRIVG